LSRLNQLSAEKLSSTKIVVTHMKPCGNCEQNIQQQIKEANNLGLTIVFPEQGKQIEL
jgi:3',5'-cyclic-nucleotide phosphodiesterase